MRFKLSILFIGMGISLQVNAQDNLTLWYEQPAQKWEEALPVGNGRIGAMVFGGIENERIQFNENTLYSGEPDDNVTRNIPINKELDRVTQWIKEGKNDEADHFIGKNWAGRLNEAYQPFGNINLDFHMEGEVTEYTRSLSLENAISSTRYRVSGIQVEREVFASSPGQALFIRIKAEKPILDFTATLTSPHPARNLTETGRNSLIIQGQAPAHAQRRTLQSIRNFGTQHLHPEYFDEKGNVLHTSQVLYADSLDGKGMPFEACLIPIAKDGTIQTDNNRIEVKECSEIVLVLYAATGYNGWNVSPSQQGKNPSLEIMQQQKYLAGKEYAQIRKEHISDYQQLFNRVSFELPSAYTRNMPTDIRLTQFSQTEDLSLIALIFQYGRYLMIAGSRPGGQPLNLQGIWNDLLLPPWNSGYTLNINLQMNYWPAEVTNLSECHEPLFRFLTEISQRGQETAREMYDLDGWVIHHNVSLWREGYPSDGFTYWFFWNMSGGWLCSHIWEHYLYTNDKVFLERYFPIMLGSAKFYSEWLVQNEDGAWVTPVGTSPENHFILPNGKEASVCPGPTMDIAIVRNLFSNTVQAARILQKEDSFTKKLDGQLSLLPPYQAGKQGQLLEWNKEYTEFEPQHRHVSHLFGLFPGHDITPQNKRIFEAARRSLENRGLKTTGWSMAWKTALWARLQDGNKSMQAIRNMLHPIDANNPEGAGMYKNLFNGAPFQIDGNFGLTAGIAEMLLQSDESSIYLLPALPSEWKEGVIKGLKARGGYTVDLHWKKGKLREATLLSPKDRTCRIVYRNKIKEVMLKANEQMIVNF